MHEGTRNKPHKHRWWPETISRDVRQKIQMQPQESLGPWHTQATHSHIHETHRHSTLRSLRCTKGQKPQAGEQIQHMPPATSPCHAHSGSLCLPHQAQHGDTGCHQAPLPQLPRVLLESVGRRRCLAVARVGSSAMAAVVTRWPGGGAGAR
jgi:hypothetical protein